MTEETAKLLIEAANRLAAALERLPSVGAGGIQIYHYNVPYTPTQPYYPDYRQPWTIGGGG